jgi:anti-sigma B factor antagonist
MEIEILEERETLLIRPVGDLDTLGAPDFSERLLQLLGSRPPLLLVDLSRVGFLSSSGLRALLAGAKKAGELAIPYAVVGMPPMVQEIFTVAGFHHFIESYDDPEAARKGLHVST